MTSEQKKRLLKAKVAVALQDELGRVPKQEEIEQIALMARVMYKAVLGLHYKRKEQKKWNSPATTDIFTLRCRSLSYSILLIVCRTLVAQCRVQPPPVVEDLQVFKDRCFRRLSGRPAL